MPIRRMLALAATLALLAAGPARAVDYRWVVGTGQGSVEASIRNKEGSRFVVFCTSGAVEQRGGIILEGLAEQAPKGRPVDVQVVVDGRSFAFSVKDGYGPVSARGDRLALANMARAMIGSRATQFAVEYPGLGKEELFSLLSVKEAIKEGRGTIVTPCI